MSEYYLLSVMVLNKPVPLWRRVLKKWIKIPDSYYREVSVPFGADFAGEK